MIEGLASGQAVFGRAFAQVLRPAARLSVSQWAAQYRVVSDESGSPHPGPWRNDRVPYLAEIMDALGLDHPAGSVTVLGSAQSGKSEAVLNGICCTIDQDPSPILVVLPTLDEARKYNSVKLQATVDATPRLKAKIKESVSRDEKGSTTFFKRFRGGFLQVTTASSSKGLQMISARIRVYEEASSYERDVGGRGSPIAQGEKRSTAWQRRGGKKILVSTANVEGDCVTTESYLAGDQSKLYVPCPHCGWYQPLEWERLRAGHLEVHYECVASGCVIEERERRRMMTHGKFVRTYPAEEGNPAPPGSFPPEDLPGWRARPAAGREPSFFIWQGMNPEVPWINTMREFEAAKGKPHELKAFWQQALARAWKEDGEAPAAELLVQRREKRVPRVIPPACLFTTGSVDVQKDRLEWAVYGFDRYLGPWNIDRGVIEGDPSLTGPNERGINVWAELERVMLRQYPDAWGKRWPVDAWGIDAGYLSQQVYRFVANAAVRERLRALDGRSGWKLPAIGSPQVRDLDYEGRKIGAVQLWPVGTWDIKSELYARLRLTIKGPDEAGIWPAGAARFDETTDKPFFEQLTAEFLDTVAARNGRTRREWHVIKGRRNEQHDLAVYCLALATNETQSLTADDWLTLAAERRGPAGQQRDLFAERLVSEPDEVAAAAEAIASGVPRETERSDSGQKPGAQRSETEQGGQGWLEPREDWLRS